MRNDKNNCKQQTGFKGWWTKHKRTVLLIGGAVALGAGGAVCYLNWDKIERAMTAILPVAKAVSHLPEGNGEIVEVTMISPVVTEQILKKLNCGEPFDVSQHVRTLSSGRRASPGKIAEAANLGIELLEGQTLVDAYTKNSN